MEKAEKVTTYAIDLGNNLTDLIHKLAVQIGVAADKIFPWYVQQTYYKGITNLVLLLLAWISVILIISLNYKKADFSESGFNTNASFTIIGIILFVIFVFVTLTVSSTIVNNILVPEYGAMKTLLYDLSQLK